MADSRDIGATELARYFAGGGAPTIMMLLPNHSSVSLMRNGFDCSLWVSLFVFSDDSVESWSSFRRGAFCDEFAGSVDGFRGDGNQSAMRTRPKSIARSEAAKLLLE
jgi:hypothetical protein